MCGCNFQNDPEQKKRTYLFQGHTKLSHFKSHQPATLLIICDESVSALDVSIQATVLNLLNQLKQKYSFTYIFISHDLSVVRHMSDKILVLHNGKIVEYNDADLLFKKPKDSYTKKLIRKLNRF